MTNPLLSRSDLPEFAAIRPEHVSPAIDALLPEAEAALERAVGADVPADYDALSQALDVPLERLSRAGRRWATSTRWPTRPSCARPTAPTSAA